MILSRKEKIDKDKDDLPYVNLGFEKKSDEAKFWNKTHMITEIDGVPIPKNLQISIFNKPEQTYLINNF